MSANVKYLPILSLDYPEISISLLFYKSKLRIFPFPTKLNGDNMEIEGMGW